MKFEELTPAQKAAVKLKGNILVSAAAGSGKTAVLVERIIDKLTQSENPLSADRILVVTFTVAAAGEMRSRLEKGLDEYCRMNPKDTYAKKQRLLLNSAKICTIDSFCMELLRENFENAGVDPDFKIAENSEIFAAQNAAVSRVMKSFFEEDTKEFADLLDSFGCVYDEKKLTDEVISIYEKAQNLPFAESWLDAALEMCSAERFEYWTQKAFDYAQKNFNSLVSVLENILNKISNYTDIYSAYGLSLEKGLADIKRLSSFAQNNEWDSLYNGLDNFKFERFSALKNASDTSLADITKETRDFVQKQIAEIGKVFFEDYSFVKNGFNTVSAQSRLLLQITKQYANELENEFKARGVLTFADVEQKALSLICENKNGKIIPRESAAEIISAYDEVLVDEYQDVNDLQDMLFKVISKNAEHLFTVGDIKQSIYGFRGANPDNFLKRRENAIDYEIALDNDPKKIIFSNNFRSDKDICDFVNYFFAGFMKKENCGMEYTSEDFLCASADIETSLMPNVEVHLNESAPELGDKLSEAKHIADYIESVMSQDNAVYDKKTKCMRKAKYGDFAIILRKMKESSTVIAAELKSRGIPVSYSKDSFLESREIAITVSLLSVIGNPTKDIDLLTVMASPIFNFTPEEIALIRAEDKKSNLYTAVIKSARAGNKKADEFIKKLSDFNRLSVLYSLTKLINVIYEQTGLINVVSMMSDGDIRRANLMLLLSEAASFEASSNGGLHGFLRFLNSPDAEKIQPATLTASGDAVKIMTIHYSKGLQFPICILGGMSSAFNTMDLRSGLVFDSEDGIAFSYFGENGKTASLSRRLLAIKQKEKMLAEELRLFYVAATRAEHRLVMMITAKNVLNFALKNYVKAKVTESNFSSYAYLTANCYADWILSSLITHPNAIALRELIGCELEPLKNTGKLDFSVHYVENTVNIPLNVEQNGINCELYEKLKANFEFNYPFERLLSLQSKVSVSALVHGDGNQSDYDFAAVPSFMLDGDMNSAQKGTATHKVMQFINFANAQNNLTAELERLKEWEFISEAEFNVVAVDSVAAFIQSNLFARMKNNKTLQREMRFLTTMTAEYLYGETDKKIKNEPIVVQGALDCVFVEEDGVVIVDFKTDRVYDEDELKTRYSRQLDIYAKACEKIYELPIKEKIIYSLYLNKEILL